MASLQQVRWASFLVGRNQGTPFEVSRTVEALEWVHDSLHRLSLETIKHIANIVNPDVKDFRTIDVEHMSHPEQIEDHLTQLLAAWEAGRCDARHFYWEFCAIHPFGSNVQRTVAVILFNWCNRTSGRPSFPPAYGMEGESNASSSS